ncbi:MAG: chorismate-binding protein [Chitinivibrionia bacterium]|nr:chorismate-binding protein [Chitinivibrionia bacterium]
MNILLIDNYDSFVFNVKQYLLELGYDVTDFRNDKITISEIEKMDVSAIVLSPGPKAPKDAGICLEIIKKFAGKLPIFGICLGHQAIGEAFGGKIVHAKELMHGKISIIRSLKKGIFENFDDFKATRYHSLAIERKTLPDYLEITCETDDGEIMGVKHKEFLVEGVQFHPESITTEYGYKILKNFFDKIEKKGNFFTQNISQVSTNLDFFDLFREFYLEFGEENVCILDSAKGPQIDRNNSIIGLFPKFDIKIDKKIMCFESEYDNLKDKFIAEFGETTCEITAFSEIFSRIKKIFNIENKLDYGNGLIGYFGYEYLHYLEEIERKNINDLKMPDIHLTYYSHILIQNTKDNSMKLISNIIAENAENETKKIIEFIKTKKTVSPQENYEIKTSDIQNTVSKEEFLKNVEIAKKYILEGDIFQVQLGNRKKISTNAKSIDIYSKIRKINPSPYMFFWQRNGYSLIGNSPELQLKIENENIEIRPIAGTSKGKGKNEVERKKLLDDLINSPKERAEHIMLVDLARNDIGAYAKAGSVKVKNLLGIEEYSNVYHIVSIVTGEIPENCNKMKIFEASFPAGTLTGAPKIRAMEIIQELEKYERGVYGGAFGFFDFNGNILSSITIRTAIKIGNNVYFQSSAGIVADSSPEDEWNETQFKTDAIKSVIEGKCL